MLLRVVSAIENIFELMFNHNLFRSDKLDIANAPKTKTGRFLLSAYRRLGWLLWILGYPVIKPVLKRAGQRNYVLIIDDAERYFMVSPFLSDGLWRLAGGGAHSGEAATDTVAREVKEELNQIISTSTAKSLYSGLDMQYGFLTEIICVEVDPGAFNPKPLVIEIAQTGWFTYEQLQSIPVDKTVMTAIGIHRNSQN